MATESKGNGTIIVTGASRGLGAAFARELSHRGYSLVLTARTEADLKKVQRELGTRSEVVAGAVEDAANVSRVFDAAEGMGGPLVGLIANAGVLGPMAPLWKADAEAWTRSFSVNTLGTMRFLAEAARRMTAAGRKAYIINVSSGAAFSPYPGWTCYGASKAATHQMTATLAEELSETPVAAFNFLPGVVETEMQREIRETSSQDFPKKERFVEMHREGHLLDPRVPAHIVASLIESSDMDLNGRSFDVRDKEVERFWPRGGAS